MKKSIKKLSFNKETVANLNSTLLGKVKAGAKLPIPELSGETNCANVWACNPDSFPGQCITAPETEFTCYQYSCPMWTC